MPQFDLDQALVDFHCSWPMLQWRTELEEFCQFMLDHEVRSFLEVGAATGRLSVFLMQALGLERVAACDLFAAPLLHEHPEIPFFQGDHHSPAYRQWREQLGHIDMVLIDADHLHGFRLDHQIEQEFPHRFIAFHDVANQAYPDLGLYWEYEVVGRKKLFINRDPCIGFGVPPLRYPVGPWASQQHVEQLFGRCCGIGVVWNPSQPSSETK